MLFLTQETQPFPYTVTVRDFVHIQTKIQCLPLAPERVQTLI